MTSRTCAINRTEFAGAALVILLVLVLFSSATRADVDIWIVPQGEEPGEPGHRVLYTGPFDLVCFDMYGQLDAPDTLRTYQARIALGGGPNTGDEIFDCGSVMIDSSNPDYAFIDDADLTACDISICPPEARCGSTIIAGDGFSAVQEPFYMQEVCVIAGSGGNFRLTYQLSDTFFRDNSNIIIPIDDVYGVTLAVEPCWAFGYDGPFVGIPDGGSATATFSVPSSATVGNIRIDFLNIEHTFVGDLCVELSHGATSAEIIQRPGADAGPFCHTGSPFGCGANDYFFLSLDDDLGSGSIEDQCTDSLGGFFTPFPDPLSALDGTDWQGTWELTVSDNASGDLGTLLEVAVIMEAVCGDDDASGVRDNGCVWMGCGGSGSCRGRHVVYADMGGANGACAPDGTPDANDRFHALNCFSNEDTLDNPKYPCEFNAPTAINVDVAGLAAPCTPDGVCDNNDAFAAINAFQGNTSCSCPLQTVNGACGPLAGNCREEGGNGTPGCSNIGCCDVVCAADSFCCDVEWDGICANEATELCNPVCGNASSGACAVANRTPGCSTFDCCEDICALDPFCCENNWDGLCRDAALAMCSFPGPAPQAPAEPRVAGKAGIRLVASAGMIDAGGTVMVDAFLDGPLSDLRGYQLHVTAAGGRSGHLQLADIAIEGWADYVFADLGAWQAFNVHSQQMLAGLETSGVRTVDGSYLATFVFQAGPNAAGTFTIDLLHDRSDASQRSFLLPTPEGARIEIASTTPAVIEVRAARTAAPPVVSYPATKAEALQAEKESASTIGTHDVTEPLPAPERSGR